MESGRTGGGSSIEGSDVDESSMNSTKALKGKKGNTSGTEDEAYDVDMEGDDEYGDAAELSWKDLKVTSPDGKKVLLSEACGRVKGRFLAIMGPSGAGKVSKSHHLLPSFPRAAPAQIQTTSEKRRTSTAISHDGLLGLALTCLWPFCGHHPHTDELDEHARVPSGQGQGQGRPNGGRSEVQPIVFEESVGLRHAGTCLRFLLRVARRWRSLLHSR